jgi:hypothetical protein
LERGAADLATFASELTTAECETQVPRDGRSIGVVVHHVASVLPTEIHLAQVLASGKPVTGVTTDDIHAMNAAHARDNHAVTREESVDLLKRNSSAAATVIRTLTDEQLDRASPVSLTCSTGHEIRRDHAVCHRNHRRRCCESPARHAPRITQ